MRLGLFLGTVMCVLLAMIWFDRDRWAIGMLVGASAPTYTPGELPADAAMAIEVARPGARIRAWVFEPERFVRGTVFLLHGIHDSKSSMVGSARRHTRNGFRAIVVDLRGHGESSGKWLTYGVREAEDLSALADELSTRSLLARPLGVIGYSYGAATAIQWAAADERVETTVALAPFASLIEIVPNYLRWMLGDAASYVPNWWLRRTVHRAGREAGFDPELACPRCVVGEIESSLLLIHGSADERIPLSDSERIRDAASARAEVKLEVVDGADHLGIGGDNAVHERISQWLDRHLVRRPRMTELSTR